MSEVDYEAQWKAQAEKTRAAGGSPCEGCGKPGVVIDVNGCDLCQECADGCRVEDGAEARDMTPELDRIEQLAGLATPGPWKATEYFPGAGEPRKYGDNFKAVDAPSWGAFARVVVKLGGKPDPQGEANAAYITALPPETALYLVRVAKAAGEFIRASDEALDRDDEETRSEDELTQAAIRRENAFAALHALLTPEQ